MQSYVLEIQSPNNPYTYKSAISLHGAFGLAILYFVPQDGQLGKNQKRAGHDIFDIYYWMDSWPHFTDLLRNEKGKVTLTKTRRVCFFTAVTLPIDVRGHGEVVTGRSSEVTGWEWLVFFFLIPMVIPGLVWWYYVIHKITFRAALARDHGFPAAIVYEGWDEAQMRDVAVTLSGAANLRLTS